jgi:Na+-transporting methylmalonyl-CoA/oxaloacetate decarboxylase gamma subunit
MAESFRASLQVTALGMGLVILTLMIVAAIIMLLGRIFKPKPVEEEAEETPADEAEIASIEAASSPAAISLNDEAAAVALAITLQRAHRQPISIRPRAVFEETEITGEVVNIVNIQPGAGVWAGTNRLQPSK